MTDGRGGEKIASPAGDRAALAALRGHVALSPGDDRALLRLVGEDRLSFLQGMVTNDVARLADGAGVHALLLTEQGKIVADLRVLALASEVWLDVALERRAAVRAALERLIVADDVEVEETSAVMLALRGPSATDTLARLGAEPSVRNFAECAHAMLRIAGSEVRGVRLHDLGDAGPDAWTLWCADPETRSRVATALAEAGATPVAAHQVELLRVLVAWPRSGVDFDDQSLAPEVPAFAHAISYRKGCYLGQEVVERIAARGHVNRLVAGIDLGSATPQPRPPPAGAKLVDAATMVEVGRLTSVGTDPEDGGVRAIGVVRRTAASEAVALSVRVDDPATEPGAALASAGWSAHVRALPGAAR